ncbi:hypothetical protein GXM_04910 [Nostoc sphaeroides CCNUC1]|uniref:Uncharacterized protein n=1 Tax=Nostoc sphaeroides CCNUC1 TaxID=2653204 RepID=A0A5P8W3V5_9NOSO|nr:hypothetical protein GXM_04910 [Nostoc sphaeroides CCNUC1]
MTLDKGQILLYETLRVSGGFALAIRSVQIDKGQMTNDK